MSALLLALTLMTAAPVQATCGSERIFLRGKPQHLHLCGDPRGRPAVVTSGDGGWIHLAPHVSEVLASRGYRVIGFDSKAYLAAFTDGPRLLTTDDVAADYRVLIDFAAQGGRRPLLIGVSEGAALSIAAASADAVKASIAGVVTLGLGELNELAWHWRDAIIYLTKRVPDEPCFRASDFIRRVSPVPLVMLQSSTDEYVPREEAGRLASMAQEPKRCWIIEASDHAFSDNRPLFDARLIDGINWIEQIAIRTCRNALARGLMSQIAGATAHQGGTWNGQIAKAITPGAQVGRSPRRRFAVDSVGGVAGSRHRVAAASD